MSIKETFFEVVRHPAFHSPAISLGLTAFSLLLLVLVLQSVPGPIRGMFWFSIPGESTGSSRMLGGVMGWCSESFLLPGCMGEREQAELVSYGADVNSGRIRQLHLCAAVREPLLGRQD